MNEHIKSIKVSVSKIKDSIDKVDWTKVEVITTNAHVQFVMHIFGKLERLADDISRVNFDFVDNENLAKFSNDFGEVVDIALGIISESINVGNINFQFNQNNINTRGFSLIKKFNDLVIRFLSLVSAIEYFDNSTLQAVSTAAKAEIRNERDTFVNWLKELRETVAQKEAALKYSGIFQTEANKFKRASNWWLLFTILLLVIAAGSAVLLLVSFGEIEGDRAILQFTLTKVIITVALFYSINMCLKNFRAQKHNQILNEHRHNALETFDLFQKSTNDDHTKNAVLLEVTRTIFGNQHTGYAISNDSDSDNVPSKIIEIIKQSPK